MSMLATSFRLFYPDSNTVSALALYAPDGALLTPQTLTDGTEDPAGFKSKVITFAAASEPLFATPTFTDPANPVSLYLTRNEAGVFHKTLDETVFDAANPSRPTPHGDNQQWLLYDAHDQGGGITTYTVKPPLDAGNPIPPVAIIKGLGRDPVTGETRYGNEFLFRWQGPLPELAEIEVDVDDIIDPTGFFPIGVTNITTYAESIVATNISGKSDPTPAAAPLHITPRLRPSTPPTPTSGRPAKRGAKEKPWENSSMCTYDLTEAAAFLKISTSALRAKAKRGDIPGRKTGKRWGFVEEHLANWISGYIFPMGVETTEVLCPSTSVIPKTASTGCDSTSRATAYMRALDSPTGRGRKMHICWATPASP